jgi:hypothetical protein
MADFLDPAIWRLVTAASHRADDRDTTLKDVAMMNTTEQPQADRIGDDLLIGARRIAAELGVGRHVVYYLAKTKRLPIGRLGKNLIASRQRLRRAAAALTA